jgi:hypothetical protein
LYHAQTVCEVAGPCQQFVHSTCNKQQKQFLVLNHSIFVNSAKETFFGIIPYNLISFHVDMTGELKLFLDNLSGNPKKLSCVADVTREE